MPGTRISNRFLLGLLAATSVAVTSSSVMAADKTWRGVSGTFWTDDTNWLPSGVPQNGDTAIFPDIFNGLHPIAVFGAQTIDTLEFGDNSLTTYTIDGPGALTLESGDIIAGLGGLNHEINCDLSLQAFAEWTIHGNTSVTVSGAIGSNFGFEKRGTGTVTLNAADQLSGSVIVSDGKLNVANDLALRSAAVELTGSGQLDLVATDVNVGSLSGDADLFVAQRLHVGSNGLNTTYSGSMSHTKPIRKLGTGEWTLDGDNSSYNGILSIDEGLLRLEGPFGGGNNDRIVVNAGATLTGTGTAKYVTADNATIAPGSPFGKLTAVDFILIQATTHINLGGTTAGIDYGSIMATDEFRMNVPGGPSNLVISYANDFVASPGDEFVILEYASRLGEFGAITFPDAQGWYVIYDDVNGRVLLRVCSDITSDCNSNGIPDACELDVDGDTVPDDCDNCPGFDDNGPDDDGDSIANDCDVCWGDDASGDTDNDGVCNDLDVCPSADDAGPDGDGDGIPDACDYCTTNSTGDIDGDFDIDLDDFVGFDACVGGPGTPVSAGCICFDIDTDGAVTLRDYAEFQTRFTGNILIEDPGFISVTNIVNNVSDKGFLLSGGQSGDFAGYSVAFIGDLNNDGLSEMLIGAPSYGTGDDEQRGRAYVVYGKTDLDPVDLTEVASGIGGFAFEGEYGNYYHSWPSLEIGEETATPLPGQGGPQGEGAGFAVASAGDVNGDGVDDMLISAPYAPVNGQIWGGRAYVVFGGDFESSSPINLGDVTSTGLSGGFLVEGERGICPGCSSETSGENGDLAGWSVDGSRDLNGDGLADIMMGSLNQKTFDYGRAYAVFGKQDDASVWLKTMLSDDHAEGLIIDGPQQQWLNFGRRVQSAGDYTGDGLADLLAIPSIVNMAYVVHGRESSANLDVDGFVSGSGFTTAYAGDFSCDQFGCTSRQFGGLPVSGGGDFNGDGRADIVVSAFNSALNETEIFVIFGSDDPELDIEARFGTAQSPFSLPDRGIRLYTSDEHDFTAYETPISIVGDLNGDGMDDLVVGGLEKTRVIFGRSTSWSYKLGWLTPGVDSLAIFGDDDSSQRGWSVDSAGDANGDGLNDLIMGAPKDDHIANNAGATFLIHGDDFTNAITHRGDEADDTLTGSAADDNMVGGRGSDTLVGNGGVDTMYGGAGDDTMIVGDMNFRRIRGGTGFDTLALSGGLTLDLEAQRGRVDEIEQIDLSAPGTDTLSVRRLDLLNLSPTSNRLFVRGTAEDLVKSLGDRWLPEGAFNANGTIFEKFVDGRAELYVQQSVVLHLSPVIAPDSLSVVENSPIDTSLGIVAAYDPDGTIVDYAIVGGTGQNTFTIDAVTGEVFVAAALDFEVQSSYTLDLEVTDNSGEFGTASITVNVICINEAPVWTSTQFTADLAEHAEAGTQIGTFAAVDPDGGDFVTYVIDVDDPTLTSPALSGAFAIGANNGILTVGDGSLLDWESSPIQEFLVYGVDSNGLQTPASSVSITLQDVQAWIVPLDLSFETQNASIWSTDGSQGLDPVTWEVQFIMDTPPQGLNMFGQDFEGEVSGQLDVITRFDWEPGSVSAAIPFKAEMSVPDEVQLGQQFTMGVTVLDPGVEPTMTGTTPGMNFGVDLVMTDFTIVSDFYNVGPLSFTQNSADYITTNGPQPWQAVAGAGNDMGTVQTVHNTLLDADTVNWNSYIEQILAQFGLPSNVGSFQTNVFGIDLLVDYLAWNLILFGDLRTEQDFTLDWGTPTAQIVFENGDSMPLGLDLGTDVTLPLNADVNADGRVDFEIHFTLATTFTNDSQFFGTIGSELTAGAFDFVAQPNPCLPGFPTCVTQNHSMGPLFTQQVDYDIELTANSPGPWDPAQGPGQFPLGGMDNFVVIGAIDLAE